VDATIASALGTKAPSPWGNRPPPLAAKNLWSYVRTIVRFIHEYICNGRCFCISAFGWTL